LQTPKKRVLYKEIKRNTCSTAKKEKKNYWIYSPKNRWTASTNKD
jgi:intergrase/recombinase